MISKIVIIAMFCVVYTLAEAPVNRYRSQRFRQAPPRSFFARQEAPYPAASGGEPAEAYGPPPTTTAAPQPTYGAPAAPSNGDAETSNPDSEVVGAPSRLTAFNERLPTKKAPQKFSQRLELQQQVQQFQGQQQQQFITPVQQFVAPVAPVAQPVAVAAPLQLAPLQQIQQDGSYFIQLPNGSIQRVNYLTQPNVDGTVFAQLQYRPVAELQATVAEPQQLYVNTVVQSHVSTDEEQK